MKTFPAKSVESWRDWLAAHHDSYEALIAFARARGFRELLGVIALPNPASIALHEALGFREAGLPRRAGLSTPGRLG